MKAKKSDVDIRNGYDLAKQEMLEVLNMRYDIINQLRKEAKERDAIHEYEIADMVAKTIDEMRNYIKHYML